VGGAGKPDQAKSPSLWFARLTPEGALDVSFGGGDGWVAKTFAVGGVDINVQLDAMLLYPDGRILGVGRTARNTYEDSLLMRFTPAGEPDPTFGTNGSSIDGFGATDNLKYVDAFLNGSQFRVVGAFNSGFDLFAFGDNGARDTGFGTNGVLEHDAEPAESCCRGAIHAADKTADGKLVVFGRPSRAGAEEQTLLARLDAAGALDGTFGTGGLVQTNYPGAGFKPLVFDGVVQSDGKLLVAGTGLGNAIVSRFHANGGEDLSFGADGGVAYTALASPLSSGTALAYALAAHPAGGAVLVGRAVPGPDDLPWRFQVIRIAP
jgi:uncharacterized delta-60 repeat protein